MVALYIITGVVLFFALLLNIRAHIHVEYGTGFIVWAKWAFVKIPILPKKEKKPKKEKPPKKEKEKTEEEKPAEEEQKKPKGPNPLKNIYDNEQISGLVAIFQKLLELINQFGKRVVNSFVIDEMFIDIEITKDDAATTAEEYGKLCRKIFPLLGAVCANCNVKKYSVNVEPDYIAKPGMRFAFSMEISLNPRKLINSVLAFVFGAVFKIGIRLIKDLKPKKTAKAVEQQVGNDETKNENNTESGVS